MSLEYVRADVLRNVHGRIIHNYGGVSGVRDENALESAIARPKNLAFYAGVESVGALAAALAAVEGGNLRNREWYLER